MIAVVHRQPARRIELEGLLRRLDADVVGIGGVDEALSLVEEHPPALAVVDVATEGLVLCSQIVESSPATSVILTSSDAVSPQERLAALLVGADEYLGAPFDREELLARARRAIVRHRERSSLCSTSPDRVLSKREREVLDLLTRGLTHRQIATALFIRPKTADAHVQHILTKLGVHSSAQAVAVASGARDRTTTDLLATP